MRPGACGNVATPIPLDKDLDKSRMRAKGARRMVAPRLQISLRKILKSEMAEARVKRLPEKVVERLRCQPLMQLLLPTATRAPRVQRHDAEVWLSNTSVNDSNVDSYNLNFDLS